MPERCALDIGYMAMRSALRITELVARFSEPFWQVGQKPWLDYFQNSLKKQRDRLT